jgi:uncharacterized protein YbjT (DUF2867 family)
MHIILGGTGHVGSFVARALLEQGEPVTVVTRNPQKSAEWERRGAQVAVADVHDAKALREVLRRGKRLFLLNPPADPSTDTDAEEKRTVASIIAALEGSNLQKIVAESTYGAHAGEQCGDLTILYGLEEALRAQPIPASIIRAAYYMSNWDASLATARDDGVVHSFYPADFKLPMVAPEDLGKAAARLLTEPTEHTGIHYVEGPERYSPADVASVFAALLNKPVKVVTAPRDQWEETFRSLGFSAPAARSYARMTAVTLENRYPVPDAPERGEISLRRYIAKLYQAASSARARSS